MAKKLNGNSPADLVLSTIIDQPAQFVAIDGARFRMLRPQEFGLLEAHRIGKMQQHFGILNKGAMTEQKLKLCSSVLVQMVELILPTAPDAVRAKLTEGQRMAIVNHFNLAAPVAQPTSRKARRAMKTNGSPSRQGSSASTAETIPSAG